MAIGVDFKTMVDARAVGSEVVVSDFFTIPGPPTSGTTTYRTVELPLNVVTAPSLTNPMYVRAVHPITHVPTGPIFTMVTSPTTPLAGQFQINTVNTFTLGTIVFNLLDGGTTVEIIYTGRGSLVFASDVNDPRDEIKDARDTEANLGVRYDKIEDGTRLLDYIIRPRHFSNVATDDFTFPRHLTVAGNLTVQGNITYIQSNTLSIGDNIIELNNDVVGAPTEDAGLEINRGSSPDAHLYWRETPDRWELTIGGLYIPDGNLDMDHNQVVSFTPEIVASGAAETTLAGSAVDGQLIWRSDIKALRAFNGTSSTFSTVGASFSRFDVVAGTPQGTYSGDPSVFDLPFNYNTGTGQLLVFYEGVLQKAGGANDYVETDGNTITLNFAATSGRNLSFINIAIPV